MASLTEQNPTYIHFDAALGVRLAEASSAETVRELDTWKDLTINGLNGGAIEYVRLNPVRPFDRDPPDNKRLLIVGGHLGTILGYAPFAAAMAKRGHEVILATQTTELADVAPGQPSAARAQALGLAAIIEEEGLKSQPLHIVAHSFGAPVAEQLVQIASERAAQDVGKQATQDWSCFANASVLLVAPAEIHREHRLAFWLRFNMWPHILSRKAPIERLPDDYRDWRGVMGEAARALQQSGPERARQQIREAATRTIDLRRFREAVGMLAILPLAGDWLFPGGRYDRRSSRKLFKRLGDIAILTPFSTEPIAKDQPSLGIRGRIGSDHGDIWANPNRVANVVDSLLQS